MMQRWQVCIASISYDDTKLYFAFVHHEVIKGLGESTGKVGWVTELLSLTQAWTFPVGT